MKGKVQTVLGLIDPDDVGFTLPHEHLLHELPEEVFRQPFPQNLSHLVNHGPVSMETLQWVRQYPYCFSDNINFSIGSVRDAVKGEMQFLKKCSDKTTLVDNGSIGLRAHDHAEFLRSLSSETGINFVLGTGFYVAGAQTSSTLKMMQEEMENIIRDDILKGIGPNEVKCGVIGEIGCSWPLLPFEKTSLAASAAIQQETGCPVIIHPGRNRNAPAEIIRIFQEFGGKVKKTVMSHLDRCFFSGEELVDFATLGSYCEFDLFGTEVSFYQLNNDIDMPSDAQRIALLRYLRDNGCVEQIVASHDIHTKHRLGKFGGHGFSHLSLNVIPMMLNRGFSAKDIDQIFYLNPKNWLTFD